MGEPPVEPPVGAPLMGEPPVEPPVGAHLMSDIPIEPPVRLLHSCRDRNEFQK